MKPIPTLDRVIIKREEAKKASQGGILLPDVTVVQNRTDRGEILAVGPGHPNKEGTLQQPNLSVGMVVLFPRQAGADVEVDGEKYLILSEPDVLAILTN